MVDVNKKIAALTKLYELDDAQKAKVSGLIIQRGRSKREIETYLKDPELEPLTKDERIEALDLADKYRFKFHTLKSFVKNGYSLAQTIDMVEFAHHYNPSHVEFYRSRGTGSLPNLSEVLGYKNLMFLDQLSGNRHDTKALNMTISIIEELMEDTGATMGIGNLVHRMSKVPRQEQGCVETIILRSLNDLNAINYFLGVDNDDEGSSLADLHERSSR